MLPDPASRNVLVTGGSGFVGRCVVRELIASGYHPVCVIRSPEKFRGVVADVNPAHFTQVAVSLRDVDALADAARGCRAAIHLVGIILEHRWRGQSFHKIHVETTRSVLAAARAAGVTRFVHMSALGTRPVAVSTYHRTKWEAEQLVRNSGLGWTIMRPGMIHGPQGEFMQMVRKFVCGLFPPFIPCFGSGRARIQPVYVRDVARCFVAALGNDAAVGQVYELGGPTVYTWLDFYEVCRRLIPGACQYKPKLEIPALPAKMIGTLGDLFDLLFFGLRLGIPFNRGMVRMALEDSVCDSRQAAETLGITFHDFEQELSRYAGQIR